MKKTSNLIYFIVTILLFTFSNFYLSNIIINRLQQGFHFSNRFINIIYAENTGAAFSIMQDSTKFLITLSVIAVLGILYYVFKNLDSIKKKEILFLSFLLAGITGNLYERAVFGCVRDFFNLSFINFPIFNISDIFINIGVIGIIILILLSKNSIKTL